MDFMGFKVEILQQTNADGGGVIARLAQYPTIMAIEDCSVSAIEELKIVFSEWIESLEEDNIPIPIPENEEDIEYNGRVTLRMSRNMHKWYVKGARQQNVSLNAYLNEALAYYQGQQTSPMQNRTINVTIGAAQVTSLPIEEAIKTTSYGYEYKPQEVN